MGKKKTEPVMVEGTIQTEKIYQAHTTLKILVESYKEINSSVSTITQTVNKNWVGKGQTEFESQYKILISKIKDFGDTLQDIYDALVKGEAAYEDQDDNLRKSFVKAISE